MPSTMPVIFSPSSLGKWPDLRTANTNKGQRIRCR
jgi:hypothetical protein